MLKSAFLGTMVIVFKVAQLVERLSFRAKDVGSNVAVVANFFFSFFFFLIASPEFLNSFKLLVQISPW